MGASFQVGRFALAFFGGIAASLSALVAILARAELISTGQAISFAALAFAVAASGLGIVAMLRRRLTALEREVRTDVAVQAKELASRIETVHRALLDIRARLDRESFDPRAYWRDRAQHYGKLAVGDITRTATFDAESLDDKKSLLPFLAGKLLGDEKRALDFGCGYGRFTHELADTIDGEAIGVDITPEFLAIAEKEKRNPKVSFATATETLPFPDEHFDLIWVSYVFIHIIGEEKARVAKELTRVLKKGGLLFMVEGFTMWRTTSPHCEYRPLGWYLQAFPFSLETYTRHDLQPVTVEKLLEIEKEFQKTNRDLHVVLTGRKTNSPTPPA